MGEKMEKMLDEMQPEQAIIQAIIEARQQSGLTQKELSERTGIAQALAQSVGRAVVVLKNAFG